MLVSTIIYLIYANAISNDNLKSVFYSRVTIVSVIIATSISYFNINLLSISKGISLYNGILNLSVLTQLFNIFLLMITTLILIYNCFYPRKYISSIPLFSIKKDSKAIKEISREELSKIYNDEQDKTFNISEYGLIVSFIIAGACFLMGTGDLITLFISIELQSYGLYILSTLYKDSEQATWGGLTYYLLGGLSSCFILLGSGLIYINTGNTSLDGFYIITCLTEMACKLEIISYHVADLNIWDNIVSFNKLTLFDSYYINISLIILTVGFLFKISAAPFHFWSPDVYDAIPTTVTTFVAIIAKLSIFVILLELVYYIDGNFQGYSVTSKLNLTWKDLILLSSLISLLVGSILGLTQHRIKRLYAYSTISHVGFILLALCINKTESIQAYIFYILSYTISNLNGFMILVGIGYTMYFYTYNRVDSKKEMVDIISNMENNKTDISGNKVKNQIKNETKDSKLSSHTSYELSYDNTFKNSNYIEENKNVVYSSKNQDGNLKETRYSPIQLVSQLKGYFYINSYLALSLAITLFSFIGVPPLIGFFAKQMVLSAALDNGYIFITLVGIITSVIAASYYLNIIKIIFFFKSDYIINSVFIYKLDKLYNKYIGHALYDKQTNKVEKTNLSYLLNYVVLSNPLSITISILTLFLLTFILTPNEAISMTRVIALLITL